MNIASNLMGRILTLSVVLAGLGALAACTTDDNDPGADADDTSSGNTGSGGSTDGSSTTDATSANNDSSTGDSTGTTGGGGNTGTGTGVCASPIVLSTSSAGIAAFDDYDGTALSEWSFPLGGDPALNVYSGPFGYGDDHMEGGNPAPEAFEVVDGNDSTYALSISDSESTEYGGGMGLWISQCLDASAFSGISLWVRGNAPTGTAKLSILMGETTPVDDGDGVCEGTTDTCLHPNFTFPVTDEWTEIPVAWNKFTPGQTPDAVVEPDGRNIWQIQFDIGLEWVEGDSGEYEPVAGEYELVVDDLTFY